MDLCGFLYIGWSVCASCWSSKKYRYKIIVVLKVDARVCMHVDR